MDIGVSHGVLGIGENRGGVGAIAKMDLMFIEDRFAYIKKGRFVRVQ